MVLFNSSNITVQKVLDIVVKLATGSLIECPSLHNESTDSNPIPHSIHFIPHLPIPYAFALFIASCASIATVGISCMQIAYIWIYITHRERRTMLTYITSTSPFVCLLSLFALYMPRVWFLSHLIGFMYFTIALWVTISLLFNLFGGRGELKERLTEQKISIETSTPPFCCFLFFLPKLRVTNTALCLIEWMVIQSPLIRLFATILSLIFYFEYSTESYDMLKVIDFLALPSLLIGIYGTHILVSTVSKLEELWSYRYVSVFRILDLFLALFGIQHAIFDFLGRIGLFGCGSAGLPQVETAFFWNNIAVTLESFTVSLMACFLLQPSRSAFFDKHPSCKGSTTASINTSVS